MQREVPASIYRGGTSRGVFFRADHLPLERSARDAIFVEIMGAGHPLQIDGLGGTASSTSKVMVVQASHVGGVDIDYEFAQVGVEQPEVSYEGNCGNLTAAVGTYAIDEGMVKATEPITVLMLRNVNTDVRVRLEIPVVGGRSVVQGDAHIPGCNVPGAPITTTFLDPGGAVFGGTLPTGSPVDMVDFDGRELAVSIVDVTSPVVFISAESVGFSGQEVAAEVNAQPNLLRKVDRLRMEASLLLKLPDGSLPSGVSAAQPKIAFCSAVDARDDAGVLAARIFSMGRMHHAFTQTGLMCTAAAMKIPGTIPNLVAMPGDSEVVRVRHPGGVVEVIVNMDGSEVRSVSVTRTARLIMRGSVFVRDERRTS